MLNDLIDMIFRRKASAPAEPAPLSTATPTAEAPMEEKPEIKPFGFELVSHDDNPDRFTLSISHDADLDYQQSFLNDVADMAAEIKEDTDLTMRHENVQELVLRAQAKVAKIATLNRAKKRMERHFPDQVGMIDFLVTFLEVFTIDHVGDIKKTKSNTSTIASLSIKLVKEDTEVKVNRPGKGECTITSCVFNPDERQALRAPLFPNWSDEDYQLRNNNVKLPSKEEVESWGASLFPHLSPSDYKIVTPQMLRDGFPIRDTNGSRNPDDH